MKIARLAGLVLAAVMAMSLVAAAVANAEPLFNPSTGSLTALTGEAALTAPGNTVTCKKSSSPGTIANHDLVLISIHFLECTGNAAGKEPCEVHSVGAPAENLILTKTLHGVLGLVLPHTPAILLLPIEGKEFVTLQPEVGGNGCIKETAVSGNVAGAVEPIGKKVLLGTIKFGESVNTHFEPSLGGLVIAKLTAFSVTAVETTSATIDYGQETEVT